MEAGRELDRAVAEALGFRRTIAVGPVGLCSFGLYADMPKPEFVEIGADDPRMPSAVIPKYSTDLNAAFTAAERVGLFGDGICLLKHREGAWRIWDDDLGMEVASGSTPALVICMAILKEHKNGRESSI